MEEQQESREPLRSFSCTPAFDALWFCYSPIYQLKEYYREGTFDPCTGKWADLMDCFRLKTKKLSDAQAILKEREKAKPHIWEFRTPEEAAKHWNEQFGEMQDS